MEKRRFALIGTGNRGTTMWGKDLLAGWREHVDLVAIVEKNALRGERARTMIGSNAPIYDDIDAMLAWMRGYVPARADKWLDGKRRGELHLTQGDV